MKLILAIIFLAYAAADRLENTYLPPNNAQTAGGNGNFLGSPIQSQSNTYIPPRSNTNAPRPQFNANNNNNNNGNYMRSRPTFNQAPAPKYVAPSAPSTKYGAPQLNKAADARFDGAAGVFSNGFDGNANSFQGGQGYNGNGQSFSGAGQSADGRAAILKFKNDNNGDGSYSFEYETENKITHQEAGSLRTAGGDEDSIAVQGSYSYTGADGIVYTVNYVADENGFQAYGDHLPTPPPIPEAILKSLELNAAQVQYNGNSANNGNQEFIQGYSGRQQYQGQQFNGNKANGQKGYKY